MDSDDDSPKQHKLPPQVRGHRQRETVAAAAATPITAITTLADAYCYGAASAEPAISSDGVLLPQRARRKTYGRGLQRLRDRLRHLDERLQLDINGLKQELLNLQLNKSLLEAKIQMQQTQRADAAVQRVMEYFGAFEHGWLEMTRTMGVDGVPSFDLDRRRLLVDRQQHFVQTVLDPVMRYGDFQNGLRVFISQWRTCSGCIASFRLSLVKIRCDSTAEDPIVTADAVISGVLTARSLAVLFPHLAPEGRLAQCLLGSQVSWPCRITSFFNDSTRIVRLDCDVDRVVAYNALSLSPVDVVETLRGALHCDSQAWS